MKKSKIFGEKNKIFGEKNKIFGEKSKIFLNLLNEIRSVDKLDKNKSWVAGSPESNAIGLRPLENQFGHVKPVIDSTNFNYFCVG